MPFLCSRGWKRTLTPIHDVHVDRLQPPRKAKIVTVRRRLVDALNFLSPQIARTQCREDLSLDVGVIASHSTKLGGETGTAAVALAP